LCSPCNTSSSVFLFLLFLPTGNGQAAVQLAEHFSRVLATDGNEQQLVHAAPAPNVTYQQGDAHSIPLPDASVDLITAASALHWFELPRFYKEARRVLKPHGCLAAWAIPLVRVDMAL
jgi:ubiquinone/menaquinone biosynthesis C-methylase UbiE